MNQEKVFLESEANAWFSRNTTAISQPYPPTHHVLQALCSVSIPKEGVLLDIGGGADRLLRVSGKSILTGCVESLNLLQRRFLLGNQFSLL